MADGFCQCGCGAKTGIADRTRPNKGFIKGQPYRFLAGHGRRLISRPIADRFWEKVKKGPGCWEWQASLGHWGYGQIGKGKKGAGIYRTHRLSWIMHNGKIPPGMCVLHKCDNPPCVRPDHLFLGNIADNTRDCIRKGRFAKGEKTNNTSLTKEKVFEIRGLLNSFSQSKIAKMYKVSQGTISHISHGRTWGHVTAQA